ncbi:MAG: helix-turn-helix domain-containing protein [Cyanobacteria bacterium P01_E01_bin.6]
MPWWFGGWLKIALWRHGISRPSTACARRFKTDGLLELNRGKPITTIAETLGVSRSAVSTWAKRYRQEGLQMLQDKPRSGRPIEIDGQQRAKVTALACSEPPAGHSRWTLR